MRHSARLLCLLASLTGTPLRQSEAADDLSRALAKLFLPATIETPDGGVGDDSEVATFGPNNHVQVSLDPDGESDAIAFASPLLASGSPHAARSARERARWPAIPSSRDPSWLQVFLF
jgi:hypothetical protein